MKLSYWYAPCVSDANCYSIRAKTKREAKRLKADHDECCDMSSDKMGDVVKITVEYADAFDLLTICQSEGGIWEEEKLR
jgi:hypothetical protein